MSLQFEEKVVGTVTAYRRRRERAVAAVEQSEQMEKRSVVRFNQIVESDVIPIFNTTAELLKESCVVQIHRHEYTDERPFVVSVDMVITQKPGVRIRRLCQPCPKLEICLKKKTFRVVIFTENLRDARLLLEEIRLFELNAEKVEQCINGFIAEIFR